MEGKCFTCCTIFLVLQFGVLKLLFSKRKTGWWKVREETPNRESCGTFPHLFIPDGEVVPINQLVCVIHLTSGTLHIIPTDVLHPAGPCTSQSYPEGNTVQNTLSSCDPGTGIYTHHSRLLWHGGNMEDVRGNKDQKGKKEVDVFLKFYRELTGR